MKSKSNIIANNAFALYFRMLFTLGVSLYTSRIVLNELGITDFGIFNVVAGVVGVLSFINNSMAGATSRFLTFDLGKSDKITLSRTFNLSISIHLLIAGIILIIAETIGLWFIYHKLVIPEGKLLEAIWVFHFSVFSAVLGILTVPYIAIINAYERMNIFAVISIVEVVLRLLIVIVLPYIASSKLISYSILTAGVSVAVLLIYYIVCSKLFEEAKLRKLIWDQPLFMRMASFAGWVLNGNLAVVGYTQGINILLNLFFGPVINASRGIAMQVQNAVNNFSYNFQKAMNPQIVKSYAVGELNRMHRLIFSSSKITFFLLFVVCIPILFNTNFILEVWLKQVPEYTIIFVQLSLIISLISTLSYSLIVAIHAYGDIKKFQIWEGTILLMIIPISYLFLFLGYGPESTLIVHLVLSLIAQIIRVWIVSSAVGFKSQDYLNRVILKLFITVPFCLILPYFVNLFQEEGWIRLLLSVICAIFSVGFFAYLFALDKAEKEFTKHFINKLIKKRNQEKDVISNTF